MCHLPQPIDGFPLEESPCPPWRWWGRDSGGAALARGLVLCHGQEPIQWTLHIFSCCPHPYQGPHNLAACSLCQLLSPCKDLKKIAVNILTKLMSDLWDGVLVFAGKYTSALSPYRFSRIFDRSRWRREYSHRYFGKTSHQMRPWSQGCTCQHRPNILLLESNLTDKSQMMGAAGEKSPSKNLCTGPWSTSSQEILAPPTKNPWQSFIIPLILLGLKPLTMFYDKVLDDGAKLVPQNSDFKVSLGCQ